MRLISTQTVPHFSVRDALHAAVSPVLRSQPQLDALFPGRHYKTYTGARVALLECLRALSLPPGAVVALPAFTCAVVALPALELGLQLKWLDTNDWGTIDEKDLSERLQGVSVLIAPHVYGQAVPLQKLAAVTRAMHVFLIADGAHLFQNTDLDHADALIVSFGREKTLSCVSGGALVWNKESPMNTQFNAINLPKATTKWTWRHATQPLLLAPAVDLWPLGGRIWSGFLATLHVLPRAVSLHEKNARWDFERATMPNAMKRILLRQWGLSAARNARAAQTAEHIKNVLKEVFPAKDIAAHAFRVTLRTPHAAALTRLLKRHNWAVGDWTGVPISPHGISLAAFQYTPGSCPNAEHFAANHVTFPTHFRIRNRDIAQLSIILQTWNSNRSA